MSNYLCVIAVSVSRLYYCCRCCCCCYPVWGMGVGVSVLLAAGVCPSPWGLEAAGR